MLNWYLLAKNTVSGWWSHGPATLGAALAFYSAFSVGPLLVISMGIAGLAFGHAAVTGEVANQLTGLLGDSGARAVETLLAGASHKQQGLLATVIGTFALVFTAVGVVVQLKESLNTIWNVQQRPGSTLWNFVRSYVISLAAVISLGFLLLVSLVITALLAAAGKYWGSEMPTTVLQSLNFVISFGFITLLFAMMFKWLPDTHVRWRDVWLGGIVTAALLDLGKLMIGFYLGRLGIESSYAGAASVLVLLLWVYYSAQIVLLGAEFTHLYSNRRAIGT
jgi:membrane protein